MTSFYFLDEKINNLINISTINYYLYFTNYATACLGPVVNGFNCGCEFGVDMPPDDDFAVRRFTNIQEMSVNGGWDFLYYLSLVLYQ